MPIVYAIEPIFDLLDEVRPLLDLHWEEIAVYKDIPLQPNWEFYRRAGAVGLVCYTVRRDGELVGYSSYFIHVHPHYTSHKWALSEIYWLHPSVRGEGVGDGLFAFVERDLIERGVAVMHTTLKSAHPAAARLLEKRGHAMVELGYEIRLG